MTASGISCFGEEAGLVAASLARVDGAAACVASSSDQSAGAYLIPQKFPACSISRPRSQEVFSSLSGTTSWTCALAVFLSAVIWSWTRVPAARLRWEITPQPWALTVTVLQSSANSTLGSRLVTRSGISSGRRVLRRMGKYLLDFSTLGSWLFVCKPYCHAICRIGEGLVCAKEV